MISGGSNGGGFAAKLYCKGETFGNRVWGYYLKDPIWDRGVIDCNPSPNITHKLGVHSRWLKYLAENAPEQRCDRIDRVNVGHITPDWPTAGNWYCQDNRSVSEATWESETGINSVLGGTGHIGTYDIEPDLAEWTIKDVWWCDWIRDNNQAVPSACAWTFNHKWHNM